MRGIRAIHVNRLALALLACAGLPAAAGAQFMSVWPVDGKLALATSSVPGRTADQDLKSSGAELQASFAPILGWTGSRWLILPLAEADYNSANAIIQVDDQRYEFLQQLDSRFELGTAWRVTPDTRYSLRVSEEGFQAKQAANETLQTGQYNYQDLGLGADWKSKWDAFVPMKTTVGLTLTDRQYPNWLSLDPSALHEKDQSIVKAYTDYEFAWGSAPAATRLGLALQSITYKEGLVVDDTGTTANAIKRKETVIDASLDVPLQFGRHGLVLGVAGEVWASNLSVYDTTIGQYIPNYNSFYLGSASLDYSCSFGRWGFLKSPQLTASLSWEIRNYPWRPARQSDGTPVPVAEQDFTRNVGLGFNSALSEHWGGFIRFNYMSAASNNYDQSSALYNYTFTTLMLGSNFSY